MNDIEVPLEEMTPTRFASPYLRKARENQAAQELYTSICAHITVYLLSIYDKSAHENISEKELFTLSKTIH